MTSRGAESPNPTDSTVLLDLLPQLVWTTEANGRLVQANRALRAYLQLDAPDLTALVDAIHPDDRESALGHWTVDRETGQPSRLEVRLRGGSGIYGRFLCDHRRAELPSGPAAFAWIASCTDIGEQHQRLRDVRDIVDASSDCIKFIDLEGHLVFMNEGGLRVMEIPDFAMCRGASWPEFWQNETRGALLAAIETARGGGVGRFDGFCRTFAGTPKWWDVTVTPMYDEQGALVRFLAISRDITERVLAERIVAGQAAILERITRGADLHAILEDVTRLIEQQAPGARCSLLLYDPDQGVLRPGAGPSLPEAYARAVNGLTVSPEVGTCGRAAHLRRPVLSEDLATDPYWESGRELARTLGLRACWSTPILGRGDQLLGTFALYFAESRSPTPDERDLVATATHLASVAIEHHRGISGLRRAQAELRTLNASLEERVSQRTRALETQTASLDAFVAFTESVGSATDPARLVQEAIRVLGARFPDASIGYFEPEEGLWRLRAWSEDVPPDVLEPLRRGVPATVPVVARPLQTGDPLFVDDWDARDEQVEGTELYGSVASHPLTIAGEARGLLALGRRQTREWTERDRALVRAVGRSLTLALERAHQSRQLATQNEELETRTRALEAFAVLARDLAFETDPYPLVGRAQEIVLSLLPAGVALYYEPDGVTWHLRAQTRGDSCGTVRVRPELRFDEAPNLTDPWNRRTARYDEGILSPDGSPLVEGSAATACLPILVHGEPRGVFAIVLFDAHAWSPTDHALLGTVANGLTLALERSEAAAASRRHQENLVRSNRDLEQFAYIASHDLKEPLRTVASYIQLLERRQGDRLDESGRKYVSFVLDAVARMNVLIEDLLAYSRIERETRLATVSVADVLHDVLQSLHATIEEQGARVTSAPLPEVRADATQLRQVFQNLIGNALKFRSPDRTPEVHVDLSRSDDFWQFSVRDNGIGIDPRYFGRIFGIFQRLHPRDRYPGSGVGLSIVKKIVEEHGGTVSVQSEPGRGTTFTFSLPVQNAPPGPGQDLPR